MRGHIIAEERFLHQGKDHHLYVSRIEHAELEYRFEVRQVLPEEGRALPEFEKIIDFSAQLRACPNTTIDQLICAEITAIKHTILEEDRIHVHDP